METQIKGIDVSKWQGNIDWKKVAGDGVKFAMVRLGFGSKDGTACKVDSFFDKNVEGALKNGVAVGCYFYSYALSPAAVKKEAAFVISTLAKYKGRILYPIAYDIEDDTQKGLGKATLTEMVKTFCSALEAAGYYSSFYCSAGWARSYLDMKALSRFDFWLAQWATKPTYSGHSVGMWQSSSTGRVAGISGDVDMDTAYIDYELIIKKKKLNGYTEKTSTSAGNAASEKVKIDVAKYRDSFLNATYKTTAPLNLRTGAGKDKKLIVLMPQGKSVRCYGYYNFAPDGTKWLSVVYDGKSGYCSSKYLKRG